MVRIIVPAYNEAGNLPTVCRAVAAQAFGPYRLYIVNDGSADATAVVAAELAATYPVTLLPHPTNRGVAAVFRTGLAAVLADSTDGDVVFIMEGDSTSDATLLPTMVAQLVAGSDVVIASRYLPDSGYKHFPWKRWILSRGANLTFRFLFPIRGVTDYSIFYRGYRLAPLRQAWEHYGDAFISSDTFFANCEILLKLRPYTRQITEVPLLYDYGLKRGKSGMKVGKNLMSYLRFIFSAKQL